MARSSSSGLSEASQSRFQDDPEVSSENVLNGASSSSMTNNSTNAQEIGARTTDAPDDKDLTEQELLDCAAAAAAISQVTLEPSQSYGE